MIKTFIERPVLSTVISIIIVMLGVISISSLPIEQYPDIAPPTIQVTAVYPGANAETVLESVIIPIEEQINGVEGMTYITSTASNNGGAIANLSSFAHIKISLTCFPQHLPVGFVMAQFFPVLASVKF